MATKYILDPSGDIIAVLPVQVIDPKTGDILTDDEGNPVLRSKTKRVPSL